MNIEKVSPEFAKDLVELINSCKGIKYNGKVSYGNTKFEYVTLDKIYAHVKQNPNFALLEPLGTNEAGQPALQIILIHKSGEALTSDYYALNLPHNGKKQDEGAAITYTKRYALGSFLGISTDGDNDANSGNGGMLITDWRAEFIRLCKENGINSTEYAKDHGIDKKTTQAQFRDIVTDLKSDIEDRKECEKQNEQADGTVSLDEI